MINPMVSVSRCRSCSEGPYSFWNVTANVKGEKIEVNEIKRDSFETKEHFELIAAQLVSDYVNSSLYCSISDIDFSKLDADYMVNTNIGKMPVEDYLDMIAVQGGFSSCEDMQKQGIHVNWMRL